MWGKSINKVWKCGSSFNRINKNKVQLEKVNKKMTLTKSEKNLLFRCKYNKYFETRERKKVSALSSHNIFTDRFYKWEKF